MPTINPTSLWQETLLSPPPLGDILAGAPSWAIRPNRCKKSAARRPKRRLTREYKNMVTNTLRRNLFRKNTDKKVFSV